MAANSTPVAPSRAESWQIVRQPQIYVFIPNDQRWPGFSALVVFSPRLRNPTSLRPRRQPRVSPATFGNPGVAKNQGPSVGKSLSKKPAKSRRARRLLVVFFSRRNVSCRCWRSKMAPGPGPHTLFASHASGTARSSPNDRQEAPCGRHDMLDARVVEGRIRESRSQRSLLGIVVRCGVSPCLPKRA